MKSIFLFLVFFLLGFCSFSQISINPKIKSKSANDVFINKVEINDNYTVVSMEFKSKSVEAQLEDYLLANPKIKRQLEQLDRFTRNSYLNQIMSAIEESGNVISIQSQSYLVSKIGNKYKFVKAFDIPVSPNNKKVSPGKSYKFTVYFEKLKPGEEEIDLMENQKEKSESTNFWNFYGIKINNPSENDLEPKDSIKSLSQDVSEIVVSGKIYDALTNKTIHAQIVCIDETTGKIVDSISTSKSGFFEFILENKAYLLKLKSDTYVNSEEFIDLSKMGFKKDFKQDFFLEPVQVKQETVKVIDPKTDIVAEKVDENTFRLSKVYFEIGEATILSESYPQLNELVNFLKKNTNKRIRIEGHTDNQGDSGLNKRLSLDRAFQVREYLVKNGVSSKRIEFKGLGDSKPIAENDTEENRKKNRRVEYVLLDN